MGRACPAGRLGSGWVGACMLMLGRAHPWLAVVARRCCPCRWEAACTPHLRVGSLGTWLCNVCVCVCWGAACTPHLRALQAQCVISDAARPRVCGGVCCWGRERALAFFGGFSCVSFTDYTGCSGIEGARLTPLALVGTVVRQYVQYVQYDVPVGPRECPSYAGEHQ